MRDVLVESIEKGRSMGANYVDLRFQTGYEEIVSAEDGQPREAAKNVNIGVGSRALAGGGWGFSASIVKPGDEATTIPRVVEEAVRLAKALQNGSQPIELAPTRPVQDKVEARGKIDPGKVPMEEKMGIGVECTKRMMAFDRAVKKATTEITTGRIEKHFASSEGTYIVQSNYVVKAELSALAVEGDVSEFYLHTEAGTKGFELIRNYDPIQRAEQVAGKAVTLARAKPAPTGKFQVLLDPDFVALLVHEVVGHPSEADRVIGKEAAWAGRVWWADKVGQRIFSDKLTIVSDARVPGHLGSFKYDDEGVVANRIVHIEKGVLKDFMQSRETAKIFKVEPNGAMRATAYYFAPLIRMTNTYIEGGDWKPEEMHEDIKEGVYLKGEKVPSIDSRRYNFQISAKEATMIRNGEEAEPLRSSTLTGVTPEFFPTIDAVGRDLKLISIPNCGKGEPMQSLGVGNGGPHVRGFGMVTGPK